MADATPTFDVEAGTTSSGVDLSISAPIANVYGLVKDGAGTLELTADNGTLGNTSEINEGTLLANNTDGTAVGNVNINAGGTLGGTGAVMNVFVADGGTLAPGASIESFDVGALSFDSGATFDYEIDSGETDLNVAADLVNAESLSIAAGAILAISDAGNTPLALGTKFTLISYSLLGGWDGGLFTYNSLLLGDDTFLTVGVNQFKIDYNDGEPGDNFTGDTPSNDVTNYVTITRENQTTAVPEASVFLFGCLACAALGLVAGVRRLTRTSVPVA
jgi:autotransporter-associated beta strand protein